MKTTDELTKMNINALRKEITSYWQMNSWSVSGQDYVDLVLDLIIARVITGRN